MNSIWDSIRLFQNHFIALASIILPFALFLEVFDAFYIANNITEQPVLKDSVPLLLVHLFVQPFYSIAIIFYLSSIISKQSISITQAWFLSIKYWPSFLILSILLSLFVFSGLMFFVIPGIILFIRFSFAEFYLLFEQQKPIDAIKSSLVNTKNYFLILLNGFLILGIFTYGPFLLINEVIGDTKDEINILSIFVSIVFDVLTIIFTVFAFRVYELSKETSD
ncbi:MAG: YciC family protein [Gammaproteobacteria bacterium]